MSGKPVSGDVIDRYFAAVNAEDWSALPDLFAPDAVLTATGAHRTRQGRADIAAYYPKALAGYPHHVDTPARRLVCGATVIVEIAFHGRRADGRVIEFDAVDIFDLAADGRVARLSSWYDTAAVAAMAGAACGRS